MSQVIKAAVLTVFILSGIMITVIWSLDAEAYETSADGYLKMYPDTDGWIYEEVYCGAVDDGDLGSTHQKVVDEWTWVTFKEGWWYNSYSKTSVWYEESEGWLAPGIDNSIYYDFCGMYYLGAGYWDYQSLYAHERAHAEGWDHYESPKSKNVAYYPNLYIYGY